MKSIFKKKTLLKLQKKRSKLLIICCQICCNSAQLCVNNLAVHATYRTVEFFFFNENLQYYSEIILAFRNGNSFPKVNEETIYSICSSHLFTFFLNFNLYFGLPLCSVKMNDPRKLCEKYTKFAGKFFLLMEMIFRGLWVSMKVWNIVEIAGIGKVAAILSVLGATNSPYLYDPNSCHSQALIIGIILIDLIIWIILIHKIFWNILMYRVICTFWLH